jgi:hypothetical protein
MHEMHAKLDHLEQVEELFKQEKKSTRPSTTGAALLTFIGMAHLQLLVIAWLSDVPFCAVALGWILLNGRDLLTTPTECEKLVSTGKNLMVAMLFHFPVFSPVDKSTSTMWSANTSRKGPIYNTCLGDRVCYTATIVGRLFKALHWNDCITCDAIPFSNGTSMLGRMGELAIKTSSLVFTLLIHILGCGIILVASKAVQKLYLPWLRKQSGTIYEVELTCLGEVIRVLVAVDMMTPWSRTKFATIYVCSMHYMLFNFPRIMRIMYYVLFVLNSTMYEPWVT